MKHYLYLFLLLLSAHAYAQGVKPELVADINPGKKSSNPVVLGSYDGNLIFSAVAQDGAHLYSHNEKGTLVRITNTPLKGQVWYMSAIGKEIYLWVYEDRAQEDTCHLYHWDGAGEPVLMDLAIPRFITYRKVIVLHGKAYFLASNRYATDLYSFDPFSNSIAHEAMGVHYLHEYKGKLYYEHDSAEYGRELFVFDPSTRKSKMVADIFPGETDSNPRDLLEKSGKLFFSAECPRSGKVTQQLFVYEGQGAPVACTDFVNTSINYGTWWLSTGNAHDIFLMTTERTGNVTKFLMHSYDVTSGRLRSLFGNDTVVLYVHYPYNGKLVYYSYVNGSPAAETKMYDLKTGQVSNMPLPDSANRFAVTEYHEHNGVLYMIGAADNHGIELYRYDARLPFKDPPLVFPNPATTYTVLPVDIDTKQELMVTLVDMAGRIVHTQSKVYNAGRFDIEVPLAKLVPGIYVYTLRGNRGVLYSGKVVKL